MPYDREQWEEKSFQVITEMDGSVRSGYFPTGEGLVDGNVAVDRAWGNFPIQPNEGRGTGGGFEYYLTAGDSHSIALTEWNSYPSFAGSRNYKVTAVKHLGMGLYEYTSQNNLQVGEYVNIQVDDENFNAYNVEVLYADATKFRIATEGGSGEATGFYEGRVDVVSEYETGHTLYYDEGEKGFYWPAVGVCNTWGIEENRFQTVAKEFIACGVPESWLTDAQFTGGDHSYDDENGEYDTDSGRVFYYYLDPTNTMGETPEGVPVYGSAFDGTVVYGSEAYDYLASTSDKNDFYLVVFQTHTPGLETADWL